jgi:hypothetical protein
MLQTKALEKTKTHFVFTKFFFEYCDFYEKMWKNVVQPERPQMTSQRMRFAN